MRFFHKTWLRIRSVFRKNRVEQELSDEVSFHFEELTKHIIAQGMNPEGASYVALRELGGIQ